MKGSIYLEKSRNRPYWIVSWPMAGRRHKISRYLGEREVMYQAAPDKRYDTGFKKAEKLLALIQGDWERAERGEITFRIEKYTGDLYTDIIPYLEQWLEDRRPNLTPAGYIGYRTAVRNYLAPFFRDHCHIMLHEIKYDTTVRLLNWIKGSGKTKKNVLDVLRACMRYAWKSERIPALPPFPEKALYKIVDKPPVWLPSDRHQKVMDALPPEHKPIFMWLYLHLRRPGEACALRKEDYDAERDVFIIRRGISNGYLVERTKTGEIHEIPCAEEFKPYLECGPRLREYFFVCSESKSEGRRYTEKLLRKYWKAACEKAVEDIDVYRGTKTSRASQMVNELGMNLHDLQVAGDWASFESVKSYARANIAKKRELLDRKVVQIGEGKRDDKGIRGR